MNLSLRSTLLALLFTLISFGFIYPFVSVFPRGFLQDDAFFYSQIGYNLGILHRSTFDGIHTTDGYHLLWAWILGFESWLTSFISLRKEIHLFVYIATYYFVLVLISQWFGRNKTEKTLLLLTGFLSSFLMETALLSLLYLLYVCLLREKKNLFRAVIIALVPLVRIDGTLVAFGLCFVHLIERRPKTFFTELTCLTLGVLLHFCSLFAISGHLVTVSAFLKTHLSPVILERIRGNLIGSWDRIGTLALLSIPALGTVLSDKSENKQVYRLSIVAIVTYLLFHLVSNSVIRPWYFLPFYYLATFIVLRCEASIFRLSYFTVFIAYAASYLLFYKLPNIARGYRDGTYRKITSFIEQTRKRVPEGEKIFVADGSGILGFYLGNVVNGDGLMNSHQYVHRLLHNNLGGYLQEEGIGYLITNGRDVRFETDDYIIKNYSGLSVERSKTSLLYKAESRGKFIEYALYRILPHAGPKREALNRPPEKGREND